MEIDVEETSSDSNNEDYPEDIIKDTPALTMHQVLEINLASFALLIILCCTHFGHFASINDDNSNNNEIDNRNNISISRRSDFF